MKLSEKNWLIEQESFGVSHRYETCFALTNGYIGIRGINEECFCDETPGTFIAGIFDKDTAQVTELVNLPNPIGLRIYINREYLNPLKCEILEFKRVLDLKQGLLFRKLRLKDEKGRITSIEGFRFVSMKNKNLIVQKYNVVCENYSAVLNVESFIDANTMNSKDTPNDRVKHYEVEDKKDCKSCIFLGIKTKDKRYKVGIASSTEVLLDGQICYFNRFVKDLGSIITENLEVEAKEGKSYEIVKLSVLVSSRENVEDIFKSSISKLERAKELGVERLFSEHIEEYDKLWDVSKLEVIGDEVADRSLKFNVFHLLSMANPEDEHVSLGAKGLHGEGYKGHVFWDTEIFMLPFYIYTNPKAARSMLMYRYNLLDAARENARKNGYKGAQFPWESADTGQEETPKWGYDYLGNPVRIWTGDIEYHISADIAFAVLEYVRATDDIEFLLNYGVEIVIETARFWASICKYNEEKDRYEINDVIGPDEFHEHCNNNAYTNYLAKWNLEKASELLTFLKENYPSHFERLVKKINLSEDEPLNWLKVASKIYIPYHSETKLIEQFEGYFNLKDFIIEEYDSNNMPVWPKGVELDKLNSYQLIKQADVVMLLYLLGDQFDEEVMKINYDYYEKRTMHKSSLSPSIYALMGVRVGETKRAYINFMRTALTDLEDNQGNTALGIHAASLGGTWQVLIFGFGGLKVEKNDVLSVNPWLPEKWEALKFSIWWKGNLLDFVVTKENVEIKKRVEKSKVKVRVKGKEIVL
ncbi:glycoside hydrolase family 65 central catalytic [Caldicellulosiruptor hydrothermalis 108]|uniref:Glycoside hydrolase family 65 central catalytic n=1 Tax=Caldicellulosiruptor hydrothermalis (strain DSM 18901 / VKM B-2411 / 108) TaxID=632292 RepID=E4Q8A9_CALH1|nr:glycosyl hydrolase family 65 protein [Caldicellulosiruptor hydrothermalis]ADQ07956.1 glycoside hydrolase family 65 central catalytic [Caldicellulosiruptor hydrothermalis 108]